MHENFNKRAQSPKALFLCYCFFSLKNLELNLYVKINKKICIQIPKANLFNCEYLYVITLGPEFAGKRNKLDKNF